MNGSSQERTAEMFCGLAGLQLGCQFCVNLPTTDPWDLIAWEYLNPSLVEQG